MSDADSLLRIESLLRKILNIMRPDLLAESVEVYTLKKGILTKEFPMFVTPEMKIPVFAKYKDKFGNDARIDGEPKYALTNPDVGVVDVNPDTKEAFMVPNGVAGLTRVQVVADVDLGEVVREILGVSEEIECLSGEAVTVEVPLGEPVPV